MTQSERFNWLVLVLGLALISLFGAYLGMRLVTPSDGALLIQVLPFRTDGVVVSPLREQPNGLRSGDVVVAVEGHSIEKLAQSLLDLRASRPSWQFGQTVTYRVIRDGQPLEVPVTLGRYPLDIILKREWGIILFAFVTLAIGAYVFYKRPSDPAARVLFLFSATVLGALTYNFGLQVSDFVKGFSFWLYLATNILCYFLVAVTMMHFLLLFPRPQPLITRHTWIVPIIYTAPFVLFIITSAAARFGAISTLDWMRQANVGISVVESLLVVFVVFGMISAYRNARDKVSRQQVRWFLAVLTLLFLIFMVYGVLLVILGRPPFSSNVMALFTFLLPLSLAFGILRYRLFDIDPIINRTLVYGALTAITMGIYVFIVGYLGNLFQAIDKSIIAFLATGLVAVLFQPLRERLQRSVNRLMYGERDDPYAVLTSLGERLEAVVAPEAVLPTIVETIAQTLKLPYVAVALKEKGDFKIITSYGLASAAMDESCRTLPLSHQNEIIGRLILAPRSKSETFTPSEERLLIDIARQVGVAAHAVRLTTDLRRSRERLVTAREEERRRLRRDLHDGLGTTLAALHLQAGGIRTLINDDPVAASSLVDELQSDIRAAIADIRRLVYDLRPPSLDELGLVGAIRARAARCSAGNGDKTWGLTEAPANNTLLVSVEAPENLAPLPAAVEVAAYRIATEALNNVLNHSQARLCMIRIENKDDLLLEVQDDGVGFPPERSSGLGLRSMHERAAELGGYCVIESAPGEGTSVKVCLPLPKE